MELAELTERLYYTFVGNRVTLLTSTPAVYGTYKLLKGVIQNDFFDAVVGGLTYLAFAPPFVLSIMCCNTYNSYRRTKEHIETHDELDSLFVRQFLHRGLFESFDRYCNLQGVYFAARKYGQLDVFNEVVKESKNRIPIL
tara:strand:+ start:26180 stop:26599 length:420 start_codon:yes stop_codon:yes gene_type:complete